MDDAGEEWSLITDAGGSVNLSAAQWGHQPGAGSQTVRPVLSI